MKDLRSKRLDEIDRLMRSDDSVDAPADQIIWAKNLFAARMPKPSLISRLVATLQLDLRPGQAAFGERSGELNARQMLFNAGEHAIDMRVTAADAIVNLQGQVLGKGFSDGEVSVSGSGLKKTARIGKLGEFAIENVPKGYYTMVFFGVSREIVLEDVDL